MKSTISLRCPKCGTVMTIQQLPTTSTPSASYGYWKRSKHLGCPKKPKSIKPVQAKCSAKSKKLHRLKKPRSFRARRMELLKLQPIILPDSTGKPTDSKPTAASCSTTKVL